MTMSRMTGVMLVAALCLTVTATSTTMIPPPHEKLRRALNEDTVVPGEYIVVFRQDTNSVNGREPSANESVDAMKLATSILRPFLDAKIAAAEDSSSSSETAIRFAYNRVFSGVSAKLSPFALIAVLHDERVAYVEESRVAHIQNFQANPPSWGLDRLDQVHLPLDNYYSYEYTGANVTVYVMDTGLYQNHPDFGTTSCTVDYIGSNCVDGQGHGTHVAGTIGSEFHGVAKDVHLSSMRVCTPSGSCDVPSMIRSLEEITGTTTGQKRVVNISIFLGSPSQSFDTAVQAAVDDGIVVVLASGNWNLNTCNYFSDPHPAIIVGATTPSDDKASFSNWGACMDVWAPGDDIISTKRDGTYEERSGTSMAAPHVAGLAALYLEEGIAPADVRATLLARAAYDVLDSSTLRTNSPNILAVALNDLTFAPSSEPTAGPTEQPSVEPTVVPSTQPSVAPSVGPSGVPSEDPTVSVAPSVVPSWAPSIGPTPAPSLEPSEVPSVGPSRVPSRMPSWRPSAEPSAKPSPIPSAVPSILPSAWPSVVPTASAVPSLAPSPFPSVIPTTLESACPPNQRRKSCFSNAVCCPGFRCRGRRVFRFFRGRCQLA